MGCLLLIYGCFDTKGPDPGMDDPRSSSFGEQVCHILLRFTIHAWVCLGVSGIRFLARNGQGVEATVPEDGSTVSEATETKQESVRLH